VEFVVALGMPLDESLMPESLARHIERTLLEQIANMHLLVSYKMLERVQVAPFELAELMDAIT
jgi:hypothetical protein